MIKKVYDIKNAGPRTRFVVRGGPGDEPMIVHNCVQAIARDIMVEAMLRVKKRLPVTLRGTVHDEIIASAKKGLIPISYFDRILSEVPAWADWLPIAASGFTSYRYRKD